jgi:hypothetical protein
MPQIGGEKWNICVYICSDFEGRVVGIQLKVKSYELKVERKRRGTSKRPLKVES